MKLIVDVSTEKYRAYQKAMLYANLDPECALIGMGIPLKKVFEDIKAEIKDSCHGLARNTELPYDEHDIIFKDEVFSILDKYFN